MSTVRIKYQCGHSLLQTVGETSSAGIGAAVLALQQQDCPACQERAESEAPEDRIGRALDAARQEIRNAVAAYLDDPTIGSFCGVADAMHAYADAWEDWQHEVSR